MKKKFNQLFYPNLSVLIFGFLFIVSSMYEIFMYNHQKDIISYVCYFLDAYFLIVIVLYLIKQGHSQINKRIENNHYLKRLKNDHVMKTLLTLYKGLIINIIYALVKLITGIYYQSIWFITFGCYYLLLGFVRYKLTNYTIHHNLGENIEEEYKNYKYCGILILLFNVILSGMICLVIIENQTIQYAGVLIYGMAFYTFYIVITNVIHMMKYKKYHSPVISAVRIMNFIQSIISMLSLEIAMLSRFGNHLVFNRLMISISGAVLSIIIISVSLTMIKKANNYLKK